MKLETVTNQSVLNAMDGIALILDRDLRIVQLGAPNWEEFLRENAPARNNNTNCSAEDVLNCSILQYMVGDTVKTVFSDLFSSVINQSRPFVEIDYRCDAPELRRDMRLSVRPIIKGNKINFLLYQSVTLSVKSRPAIPLFETPVADTADGDILTLCAICARVAWPIGAQRDDREWIDAPEYYAKGGREVALISHGFCEDCFERLENST